MSFGLVTGVILIFALNVIGNSLNTLKTIFLARNIVRPTYLLVFIESVIFFSSINQVSQGNGMIYLVAFALGKTAGTWAGSYIENKMALGIVQISLYIKCDKAKQIADDIRAEGYTVTTHKGYGNNGNPLFEVCITLNRKEIPGLKEILARFDLNNTAMIQSEVSSIEGKIPVKGIQPSVMI